MGRPSDSSSSGDEDGDEQWKAAINSIAASNPFLGPPATSAKTLSNDSARSGVVNSRANDKDDGPDPQIKPQMPKHYIVKAQKLLDDIVEKNLEFVKDSVIDVEDDTGTNGGGIRLFKNAPPGIAFDQIDELQGPTRKPRIKPGEEIDEKSKKFRRKLESAVVDGCDVISTAEAARKKSLARLQAKDAAAKAALEREEERVAELKRIRGERWLPSIAKEMKLKEKKGG